ncbi:MAG: hypothetical protein JNK25_04645 [Phycisphaerae bacterium]|nr:hypothetical protein [Phycisphaerae bacterium]
MSIESTIRLVIRAALLVGIAVHCCACGGQRPLHVILKDGEFASKTGQYDKAIADLGEYVARKPEEHRVRYELALAYIGAGQPRKAVEELNICLDVKPLNDDYLNAYARALYDSGERDALLLILRRYAAERGRVSDYIRLGEWSSRIGNADESKEALLTAAKIDQGLNIGPQLALANFYASVGDKRQEVRRVRMAYFIDPTSKAVLDYARRLGEVPGPTFPLKPEEYEIK